MTPHQIAGVQRRLTRETRHKGLAVGRKLWRLRDSQQTRSAPATGCIGSNDGWPWSGLTIPCGLKRCQLAAIAWTNPRVPKKCTAREVQLRLFQPHEKDSTT